MMTGRCSSSPSSCDSALGTSDRYILPCWKRCDSTSSGAQNDAKKQKTPPRIIFPKRGRNAETIGATWLAAVLAARGSRHE
jgi:hypothetical protein